jgi:hypothetical protein
VNDSEQRIVETEHLSSVHQLPDSYIVTEAAVIVRCC